MEASLHYALNQVGSKCHWAKRELTASNTDMVRCKVSENGKCAFNDVLDVKATRTFEHFILGVRKSGI